MEWVAAFQAILIEQGKKQTDAANALGIARAAFQMKMAQKQIRLDEFCELMKAFGVCVYVTRNDKKKPVLTLDEKTVEKIGHPSIQMNAVFNIIRLCGLNVKFVREKDKKEILVNERPFVKGIGSSIRRTVNSGRGVSYTYDTRFADAIANDFYRDGKVVYQDGCGKELYRDLNGKYFFVKYVSNSKAKIKVIAATEDEARDFVKKYRLEEQYPEPNE